MPPRHNLGLPCFLVFRLDYHLVIVILQYQDISSFSASKEQHTQLL